jgi:acetyl esterase/lipase
MVGATYQCNKANSLIDLGGGWNVAGGQAHLELGASTVRKAEAEGKSLSWLVVQYNLAPTSKYPTQISQCVEALTYILNKAGKNPSNVILAEDSAGGTLIMGMFSHILHPHPKIKPLTLASPLKGAVLLSPWLNFEMSSPWVLENQLRDPAPPDVMRGWVKEYLGEAPLDNYNQPGIAPADWWNGLPVKQVLITGGAREMLAEDIAILGEKIKVSDFSNTLFEGNFADLLGQSVHKSTTVFFAATDFHAQPVIGPELGLGEGEAAGVVREWILRQVEN